jgi:hypothetical protein
VLSELEKGHRQREVTGLEVGCRDYDLQGWGLVGSMGWQRENCGVDPVGGRKPVKANLSFTWSLPHCDASQGTVQSILQAMECCCQSWGSYGRWV